MSQPRRIAPRLDRAGGATLTIGLAAIAAYNAWKWRGDRALAAGLRAELDRPRPRLKSTPRVSILVAAWNEAGTIARHLESVDALDYPNLEYVLCAGGGDGTLEIARRHAGARAVVLEQAPGEGKQRALRKAYERATGEIVYLTDADCVVGDVAFERVIAPLIEEGEAAASGSSIAPPEQRWRQDFAAYLWAVQQYGLTRAPAYVDGLLGRNAAVRRDALEACGAFAAAVPTGTDYHLAKALRGNGYRIRNVPASLVVTPYPTDWGVYARQQRRWLRNVALLGARSGAWNEVRASLQTSLLGAAMLAGWATLFAGPAGRLPFALWCLGLAQCAAAKLRYAGFGRLLDGRSPDSPARSLLAALGYSVGEFVVWALPLTDYPVAARRQTW